MVNTMILYCRCHVRCQAKQATTAPTKGVQKYKSETSRRLTDNDGVLKVFSDCSGISSEMIALFLLGWPSSTVKFVGGSENDPVKRCLLQSVHRTLGFSAQKGKIGPGSLRSVSPDLRAQRRLHCWISMPCIFFSWTKARRSGSTRAWASYLQGHAVRGSLQASDRFVGERERSSAEKAAENPFCSPQSVPSFRIQILRENEHGVPQSRQRVYVIAFLQDKKRAATSFRFPKRLNCAKLQHFLKPHMGSEKIRLPNYDAKYGTEFWKQDIVLDIGCSKKFQSVTHGSVPCLTRGRCLQQGYYIPRKLRRLSRAECARLQSVPQGLYEEMIKFLRKKWYATTMPMRQKPKALAPPVSWKDMERRSYGGRS